MFIVNLNILGGLQFKMKTRELTYIGIFTSLITICSWISIPSTVPFTLQTMGIFLTVGLIGGKRGSIAVLIYILLGAIGLPVFAGFTGGIGSLFGSAGGYKIGFLASALVMWAISHCFGDKTPVLATSMAAGLIVCYALGTAWFMIVYTRNTGTVSLSTVLSWCVIPFIIPDIVKIVAALILTKRLKSHINLD